MRTSHGFFISYKVKVGALSKCPLLLLAIIVILATLANRGQMERRRRVERSSWLMGLSFFMALVNGT